MAKELSGGKVNRIWLADDGMVHKVFEPTRQSLYPSTVRFERERLAMLHSNRSTGLAPRLYSADSNPEKPEIVMEYVEGDDFQTLAEKGDTSVIQTAGATLRKIHTPVARNPSYIQNDFNSRLGKATERSSNTPGEGLNPDFSTIDWQHVFELGTHRLHGDYWLSNLKKDATGKVYVIDWEYARTGSPYQDFVFAYMNILSKYGHEDEFWKGYGSEPDKGTLLGFIRLQLYRYLTSISNDVFQAESPQGFYHGIMDLYRSTV